MLKLFQKNTENLLLLTQTLLILIACTKLLLINSSEIELINSNILLQP